LRTPFPPPRGSGPQEARTLGAARRAPLISPSHHPREQQERRFNREIGRRTDVVGIFPDDPSLIRLVSMLAIEANDEWLVGRSYISQGSMATLYESRSGGSLSFGSEEEVAELAAA